MVNKLIRRIKKLDDWQTQDILIKALNELDEVQLQGIAEEVEEFEEFNKEGN